MSGRGPLNRRPPGSSSTPTGDWWTLFDDAPQRPRRHRRPPLGLVALVIVLVLGVGGGLLWLGVRSSGADRSPGGASAPATLSPDPSAVRRLHALLPPGYPPGICGPTAAPTGALAALNCGRNTDPTGPASATFTIVGNDAALQAVFLQVAGAVTAVDCPGPIHSPGPWRRNSARDRINGTLLCGYRDGAPSIVWTATDTLLLSAVRADAQVPSLDGLFTWWTAHS